MRRVSVLLTLCMLAHAHLFINRNGTKQITAYNGTGALLLPNTTLVGNVDVLVALSTLQQALQLQQQQIVALTTSLAAKAGCAWSGIGCNCLFVNTTSPMIVIVQSSNCTDGVLQWTRVTRALVATVTVGCSFFNLSFCDVMF